MMALLRIHALVRAARVLLLLLSQKVAGHLR
jgi:hypothetical protein